MDGARDEWEWCMVEVMFEMVVTLGSVVVGLVVVVRDVTGSGGGVGGDSGSCGCGWRGNRETGQ